jgi:hypothetical protein
VPGVRDGGAVERAADAPGEVREGRARGGAGEDVDGDGWTRRERVRDRSVGDSDESERCVRGGGEADVLSTTGSGRWGANDGGGVRGGAGGADGASEDDAAEGEFSD